MSPDPVEQLLERHGEHWRTAFVPPPLDGMLAVATAPTRSHARWVWPLVAAVALLVIPLATVLAVHGSHRSPVPAASHPTASHPSPTATQPRPNGLLGSVDWSSPVLQADGRTVTVAVDVNRTPNLCLDYGLPVLRAVLSETAITVTLTVQAYPPSNPVPRPTPAPGTVLACSAIGRPPVPLTIKLSKPLGNRTLIDGMTGTHHPVLKASTLRSPTYLPAGYVDRGIQWNDDVSQSQVLHDYIGDGLELRLVRGHGNSTMLGEQQFGTGIVLGHPAKLTRTGSPVSGICLLWSEPAYSWSLCSVTLTGKSAPLGADELLRIGNSIR